MNAKKVLSVGQKVTLLILFAVIILGLYFGLRTTVITILSVLTLFYSISIAFTIYIMTKALFDPQEIQLNNRDLASIHDSFWPRYTILCPLYQEANILPDFVENMTRLDYPKDRLQCLILLECDDQETIKVAERLNLPPYFQIIFVPNYGPKTKPKACNFGLKEATGDYIVIYDAEDRPDLNQLKMAALAFNYSRREVACIQAKLNFYNPRQNILTRLFTAEYTLWFDLILPGLQAANAPIPLGGTSNHFRTKLLKEIGGWDSYNVTEDCDLGVRLSKLKFKTAIIDSITWEEANSKLVNWLRQRSRWIKGYLQTFFVHTRNPLSLVGDMGIRNSFIVFLVTGFLPLASLINPVLWLVTICYFVFRPTLGPVIEQFFPAYLLYPSVLCLLVGNFVFLYSYMIAAAKKKFHGFTRYGYLSAFSWILISFAGWYAVIQLIFKPHYWEKTKHGLIKQEADHV